MAKKETKKDHNHAFTLTIPWGDISAQYNVILKKSASSAVIKGFRKGKAPIEVVEKSLDKTKLYSKALESILPHKYLDEVKNRKLVVASDPQISVKNMEQGQDWVFKVKIAKPPEVTVGDYKSYIKKALSSIKPQKTSKTKKKSNDKGEDKRTTALFDSLLESTKVKISSLQIDQEADRALDNLAHQLSHMNMKIDDYLKSIKKSKDKLVKEYQETAERKLKLHYALEEITKIENPKVTPSEIKKISTKKEDEKYIEAQLKRQKVIDKLLEL